MLDTLKYSHQLEAAGIPREQAEAQAEALREALVHGELATKGDLKDLEAATKANIQELRAELKADTKDLETRLTTRMYALHGATIAVLFGLFKLFS